MDRTHRIGQTRNVMVYRLIASGTIEEKVMALKARKQELFSSVIDSDGAFSSALSADDIRALFAYPPVRQHRELSPGGWICCTAMPGQQSRVH